MDEFIKEVEKFTGVHDLMSLDMDAFEDKINMWLQEFGGKRKKKTYMISTCRRKNFTHCNA